jgi:type II secretory pathway pseudopilin PulG
MKHTDSAFTLMETLLAVAIILVAGGVLVTASGSALKGVSQSFKAINTASTLSGIDRYIRIKTDETHIPYWADNKPYIDALSAELYQSRYGAYIKSINVIVNYPKAPRGIEVVYVVNNCETRTLALFPSTAVVEPIQ